MKRSEIAKEIEETIFNLHPDLHVDVLADRGQPDLLIGQINMCNSFSVYDYEWIGSNPRDQILLIKIRIKETLCEMRDKINKDIERIEK